MAIWMDLTNSLSQHKGSVVGIVRTELMLAKYLHQIDPLIRFSIMIKFGFQEVKVSDLKWLFDSSSIDDDYLIYQKRKESFLYRLREKIQKKITKCSFKIKRRCRDKSILKGEFILYPYKEGDMVYSCGWFGTKKEDFFLTISKYLSDFKLVYTIYDLCLIKGDMNYLYYPYNCSFRGYLDWIAENCSAIVYGGKTTKKDAEKYFTSNDLPILDGYSIKWGNDFSSIPKKTDALQKFNISLPYILTVGSVNPKKNYNVLYRAYCMMRRENNPIIPQLIIVGGFLKVGPEFKQAEFERALTANPLVKDHIKVIQCSDEDLVQLYSNCLFTVMPTLYEGWSLTLPESFYYGKLCICSDVAPLREVGGKFAYYVDPNHPKDWMNAIQHFVNHPEEIEKFEKNIRRNWKSVSWEESAQNLYHNMLSVMKKNIFPKKDSSAIFYCDIGLLFYPDLSGIPRTQMLLARYLYQFHKNIKFFWMKKGEYCELSEKQLSHLLGHENLDKAVKHDRQAVRRYFKTTELPFRKQDIVFSAGVGYDEASYRAMLEWHTKIGFKCCSVCYDFTPITVPHTHPEERVRDYPKFLNSMYALSDFIFYGGATAQKDGAEYQKKQGLPIKDSAVLKWGSDIVSHQYTLAQKKAIFKKYGITGDFILTVGTVEARKNHETLYRAYLELLKDKTFKNKLPQLIICGHSGWKTENFVRLLRVDERIRGKVIHITPDDMELDILYQTCKFTCLASFYEGWSLTLPESLNYGKFCLASDTPSLKETGEDIIDYANPYDPVEWAEKIKFYYTNKAALKQKEEDIKKKWRNTTWKECASRISDFLKKLSSKEVSYDK